MAPERFQGRCDVRADIYSLGLTLYEVASLRPAYDGSERHKLMDRVLHEDPVRLRKVAPSVPRDLETIIHKAMAREPAERYAAPAALAEDLQRFLSDKPIRARHVTATERLFRWARRNPAMAALSAGLIVLLVGTAVASTLAAARFSSMADQERQTRREVQAALKREEGLRRKTDAALEATAAAEAKEAEARRRAEANQQEALRQKAEAVRQQKIAEANFQLARQAVNAYLSRVSESRLLRVPGLQPLRKELLESALTYYQGFLNQRTDDRSLQSDVALAYARLAGITAEIGSKSRAAALMDRSLEIRKRLQAADPGNPARKLDLVNHDLAAAALRRQLGEYDAARKACRDAYGLLLGISPQDPDRSATIKTAGGTALNVAVHQSPNPEILERFARVLEEQGTIADASGHPTDALTAQASRPSTSCSRSSPTTAATSAPPGSVTSWPTSGTGWGVPKAASDWAARRSRPTRKPSRP